MNEENLIVTLDDNKDYSLINKMEFEGKNYIYLIELNNFSNIVIGEINEDVISVIEDPILYGKLFMRFGTLIKKDTE